MTKLLRFVLLTLCSCVWMSESANILVVFPFPSKSHDILGEGLVRILTKSGHEVTYITPFPKEGKPFLRYIGLSGNLDSFKSPNLDLKAILDKKVDVINMDTMKKFSNLIHSTFINKHIEKLINNPNEKFDLVIIEWLFSEMYAGLAAVFDCPYIWLSSVNPHWIVLSLIDEGLNPSFNPDILSSNLPPFNFFQRLRELFCQVFWFFMRLTVLHPPEKKHYYDIFGPVLERKGRKLPSFEELTHNASLMFGNSDVSTGRAMTLPENYKHIAGYHIDTEVKPLPEDLRKIIENAKDGVIYFSLGSNLKSKDLPDELKQSLLKMFGSLKYTILWKFEEKLTGVPKNVHILDWAPQPSILSHANCKLFITHGGLLSTIETIHFGVPIIGIPVFADQFTNVETAKKKGFALKVELSYGMADELKVAIEEILSNPKYKQKIDEVNLIFHDRPITPDAEVVHWVNHVIHTKGAPHLRSVALMVPWYQKYYVDFLALVLIIMYVIVKFIKWLCCSRKKIASSKKND